MDVDPFEEPIDNKRYLALARKYADGAYTYIDEPPELKNTFRGTESNIENERERLSNLLGKVERTFTATKTSRRACLETIDALVESSNTLAHEYRREKDAKRIEKHLSWMRDVRRHTNVREQYHPRAKAIVSGFIDELELYWTGVKTAYERTGIVVTSPFFLRVLRKIGCA